MPPVRGSIPPDISSRASLKDASLSSWLSAVPAAAFFLSYSSLASAISRCSRAILRSRLSPASSSLKSPSSSVPSWRIRCLLVEVRYDFRLPSTRSEKSAAVASTLEGRNRDLASSMRSRDREMPVSSSRSSSSSECEGPVVYMVSADASSSCMQSNVLVLWKCRPSDQVSRIYPERSPKPGVRGSCPSRQAGQKYQVGQVGIFPIERHVGGFEVETETMELSSRLQHRPLFDPDLDGCSLRGFR